MIQTINIKLTFRSTMDFVQSVSKRIQCDWARLGQLIIIILTYTGQLTARTYVWTYVTIWTYLYRVFFFLILTTESRSWEKLSLPNVLGTNGTCATNAMSGDEKMREHSNKMPNMLQWFKKKLIFRFDRIAWHNIIIIGMTSWGFIASINVKDRLLQPAG